MPREAARRPRHDASDFCPAWRAITSSGRIPAYVVRQLSRCTRASAPASSGDAARRTRPAATESLDNALHGFDEVPGVHAEELVDVGGGRRFAEAIHANRGALEAHVLAPVIGDAGFDAD